MIMKTKKLLEILKTFKKKSRNYPGSTFDGLYNLLLKKDHLLVAFNLLKHSSSSIGASFEEYGANLDTNLSKLLDELITLSYKPLPAVESVYIKNGKKVKFMKSTINDKIVQKAVSLILDAIYSPNYIPTSFGYREGLGTSNAIEKILEMSEKIADGAIIKLDIKKHFDSINHKILLNILALRIKDENFFSLIKALLVQPIIPLDKSEPIANESIGLIPGSNLSPTLSNIFLDYVIDHWFEEKYSQSNPNNIIVRYADDIFIILDSYKMLGNVIDQTVVRLNDYDQGLNLFKTGDQPFGYRTDNNPASIKKLKDRNSFNVLGFKAYWKDLEQSTAKLCLKGIEKNQILIIAKIKDLISQFPRGISSFELIKRVREIVSGYLFHISITRDKIQLYEFAGQILSSFEEEYLSRDIDFPYQTLSYEVHEITDRIIATFDNGTLV